MFTRVISQSKVEIQQALLEEIGKYSHTVYHTGNKVNEIVTQTTLTSLGSPETTGRMATTRYPGIHIDIF